MVKKWSLAFGLFNSAFEAKKILTTYKEDKLTKISVLCVHPDYKNRGIGTELMKRSLDHASHCGTTLFGTLCTSIYTQQMCEKQGFEKVKEVYYSTYVDSETKSLLYKDVEEPHKAAISYIKRL